MTAGIQKDTTKGTLCVIHDDASNCIGFNVEGPLKGNLGCYEGVSCFKRLS